MALPMTAPEPGAGGLDANVRGMLVLAAAVVVGLLLLWKAGDGGAPTTAAVVADKPTSSGVTTSSPLGTDVTTSTGSPLTTTTGGSTGPTTTTGGSTGPTTATTGGTTAPAGRQPSAVSVLVLNGSGLPRVARSTSSVIKAKGYDMGPAANAAVQPAKTVVYFKDGYQADATLVAALLGKGGSAVQPKPAASPGPGADAASVVVVLGKDTSPVSDTTTSTG